MSENKQTVEKYMDAFSKSDHEQVLSCLADDVEWEIPGAFHVTGKAAFDKEIENPAFPGRPSISTSRMTEENDVVVAEERYTLLDFSEPMLALSQERLAAFPAASFLHASFTSEDWTRRVVTSGMQHGCMSRSTKAGLAGFVYTL